MATTTTTTTTTTTSSLADKHCHPIKPGTPALGAEKIAEWSGALPGWVVKDGGAAALSKTFNFKNYYETIAFVNAVAWVSHHEDHHPDLEVGYNRCKVAYSTHSVGGLSENDFICAAKVERLFK